MSEATNNYGTIFYGDAVITIGNTRPDKKVKGFRLRKVVSFQCSFRKGKYCCLTYCVCPYRTTVEMPKCVYSQKSLTNVQLLVKTTYVSGYSQMIKSLNKNICALQQKAKENLQQKYILHLKINDLQKKHDVYIKNKHILTEMKGNTFNELLPFEIVKKDCNDWELKERVITNEARVLLKPVMLYLKDTIIKNYKSKSTREI